MNLIYSCSPEEAKTPLFILSLIAHGCISPQLSFYFEF